MSGLNECETLAEIQVKHKLQIDDAQTNCRWLVGEVIGADDYARMVPPMFVHDLIDRCEELERRFARGWAVCPRCGEELDLTKEPDVKP